MDVLYQCKGNEIFCIVASRVCEASEPRGQVRFRRTSSALTGRAAARTRSPGTNTRHEERLRHLQDPAGTCSLRYS